MGATGGFCRNSVANTAKPATLGKSFCIRQTGLPAPCIFMACYR
jgi:hypothetical protein